MFSYGKLAWLLLLLMTTLSQVTGKAQVTGEAQVTDKAQVNKGQAALKKTEDKTQLVSDINGDLESRVTIGVLAHFMAGAVLLGGLALYGGGRHPHNDLTAYNVPPPYHHRRH
ncbi:uncharacterized protein LOC121869907 [Homarus americanus]|uniref:uncharacterized protein LOC121869907 n=1 Tax=Homarus americanus TaxID=6706 RepID=UPI001C463AA7|nr:uncharacterized protein LOC121869907 [Homarus americanus]